MNFSPASVMKLSQPQMLPGNAFKFRVSATEGATYVVDYSDDFTAWTPLLTNSLSSLGITNSVPGANQRFYRMRQVP
jgi:hypothetical protein